MVDPFELPIPAWGLRCPACDRLLDGAPAHACPLCGREFSVCTLLVYCRPIPDIGLCCRACGYLLTGLHGDVCPECGQRFNLAEQLERRVLNAPRGFVVRTEPPDDFGQARHPPRYDLATRPLPDYGLLCAQCGAPLAGAPASACACGAEFELDNRLPRGDPVDVQAYATPDSALDPVEVLYDAGVPFSITTRGLRMGRLGVPAPARPLLVPRAYLLDALNALQAARADAQRTGPRERWWCSGCGRTVPATFDVCWNCGTAREAPAAGPAQPAAPIDPATRAELRRGRRVALSWALLSSRAIGALLGGSAAAVAWSLLRGSWLPPLAWLALIAAAIVVACSPGGPSNRWLRHWARRRRALEAIRRVAEIRRSSDTRPDAPA